MGDIGNAQGGGCLPGCSVAKARSSEGEPITGTSSVSGSATAPGSTEREEGEETDKYTANMHHKAR